MLITASRILRLVIAVGMIPITAGPFNRSTKIQKLRSADHGKNAAGYSTGSGSDRAEILTGKSADRRSRITVAEMYLATRQRDGLPESSMGPRLETASTPIAAGVTAESRPNTSATVPGAIATGYSILNSSFIVHSQDFVYNAFSLAYGARLEGDWRVRSKDIEVLIIDASALDSYRNGGQYSFYYDQRAGSDHVSVDLPAGQFAVVFNNRYSILTDKSVKASLCAEVDQ